MCSIVYTHRTALSVCVAWVRKYRRICTCKNEESRNNVGQQQPPIKPNVSVHCLFVSHLSGNDCVWRWSEWVEYTYWKLYYTPTNKSKHRSILLLAQSCTHTHTHTPTASWTEHSHTHTSSPRNTFKRNEPVNGINVTKNVERRQVKWNRRNSSNSSSSGDGSRIHSSSSSSNSNTKFTCVYSETEIVWCGIQIEGECSPSAWFCSNLIASYFLPQSFGVSLTVCIDWANWGLKK